MFTVVGVFDRAGLTFRTGQGKWCLADGFICFGE
jgi:hypothetical protein